MQTSAIKHVFSTRYSSSERLNRSASARMWDSSSGARFKTMDMRIPLSGKGGNRPFERFPGPNLGGVYCCFGVTTNDPVAASIFGPALVLL